MKESKAVQPLNIKAAGKKDSLIKGTMRALSDVFP